MKPKMKFTAHTAARPNPENSWVAHKGCACYVLIANPVTRFVFSLSAILVASLGLAGAVRTAEPYEAFLEKIGRASCRERVYGRV